MRLRSWLAVAAMLGLTGCDEPTVISHVDRMPHMVVSDLWTLQDGRGIPVEIHGSPWRRVADNEIAEAMRAPARTGDSISFYSQPVGGWEGGHPWRIVLHFNPRGGPNAFHDCRLVSEAVTDERMENAYSVNLTFCKQDKSQAHGYMQVLSAEPGDFAAWSNHVQNLFGAIFKIHESDDSAR